MRLYYLMILYLLFTALSAKAQEDGQVYVQGRRYLDINIRSLEKYEQRSGRVQMRLLQKLQTRERKLARKLSRTDSAAYARMKDQSLSFDSIARLARHPDSATLAAQTLKSGRKTIDSLKAVYSFLQLKAGGLTIGTDNKTADVSGYENQLANLQGRLSYDQYITDLINKHTSSLQSIAGSSGVTGIQKEVFYAKSKMNEWKKLAEEPSKLEDKALEYLQGTKGFDLSINRSLNGNSNSPANNASADDLEKMGFQTKRQLNTQLQQKLGNNLQSVQGTVGKEVGQWQDKAQDAQQQWKDAKHTVNSLKHTQKPAFKVNPMRGLPFWRRIEKQYSFQTSRATNTTGSTSRPAMLSLSGTAAYRQTPKLSLGVGLAGDLGLGQSWSAIRFTFEGVGVRAFLSWEWQYGIGLYAGYERTWKQYAFTGSASDALPETGMNVNHSTNAYSESVLLGLTKKYRINAKWNGAIQVLYDVWWQEKGLRSPVVLRFVQSK